MTDDLEVSIRADVDNPFLHPGCLEISRDLIEKLVQFGWNRDQLLEFQKRGFRYCPERGTLISPAIHYSRIGGVSDKKL